MFIMPELVLQRVIKAGLEVLKQNPEKFDEIFENYSRIYFNSTYGQSFVDDIKSWFLDNKIPVVQSWSMNVEKIPGYSVHLGPEAEDTNLSAINDFYGNGETQETSVGVFDVTLRIGMHASREGDYLLWMYYVLKYILFNNKRLLESLGIEIHTFSASDWVKDEEHAANNIYSRYLTFTCKIQDSWNSQALEDYALKVTVLYNDQTAIIDSDGNIIVQEAEQTSE